MKTIGMPSLCIALLLVQACSHPIEIEGEGDVMSASGNRHCLLEDYQGRLDNCTENQVTGAYEETFYPVARPRCAPCSTPEYPSPPRLSRTVS